ncbi:ParB/RepB/Spo0J family partition protein [Clostridium intestinale]|jgi:ParB family chromosome partitioning protein|uniref:Stage 0 sporulation protein J n=2 Tax=Clostridium intestinale TaxID=36845 RepID=U2PXZ6_9CLOT|nr:ParB/RepB/Spo0J family partition protein [Clostridium intestinale]ERK28664.1 stage 0 sporulation protein J [Clostridium intestinale URNW]QLY80019.1 ParB/RepB/Spo0J family partition protein [Clostridium intestinale]
MSKKFGLGKGLNALIPNDYEEITEEKSSQTLISLNDIKANREQPRKSFDNEKILELSQSIKNHGIIQPLILKKKDDFYVIIAGERRWRAAKLAGLKEVPAIIMDITDRELLELSLIENIQREDLNPIEEGKAFKKLLEDFNLTQESLSETLSKSRTSITNTMRLLNLDDRVQDYIIDGVISEGHGRTLLGIKEKDLQYELAQKVIDDKISVRELEKIVRNITDIKNEKKLEENIKDLSIYYNDIREKLENYFGTKVNIEKKKNKGKIEIEYYSEEDLQRILDIINMQ